MMWMGRGVFLLASVVAVFLATPLDHSDWANTVRQAQARFSGKKGTLAHFGDSITVTMAYWAPLRQARHNAPPEMEQAYQKVASRLQPECWSDWKGPQFGSEGGRTARWAAERIGEWLQKLNPEVAVILFGTNDLSVASVEEYRAQMQTLVRQCLENGTIPILTTIPPRHGFVEKSAQFAEAVRELSREWKVPLVDYHAEILKRRPNDWDGALDAFRNYNGYDVPTLIARDGVHPSNPTRYQNDYSEEGMSHNGYVLRNYLTLMCYAQVIGAIEEPNSASGQTLLNPPRQPWFPKAPPLPQPTGEVIRVRTPQELYEAAARVKPGGTILLADGLYRLSRRLEIRTDDVTLRGASGQRENVVLDGGGMGELLCITDGCSGVTIADLTVQNVRWNGIKIDSDKNVQRVTIYNCILHNIWQRAVKGVRAPETRPTDCRVQYCLFYNDRPKQFSDDDRDNPATFGGNYIGGIDVMHARRWVVSDNVFVGIHGRTGSARGAIFIWMDSQDCVVERNIIIDCDSGICLGNSHKPDDVPIHATRCIVRNNFVTRAPENGILADYTRDCKIVNNTVYDPNSRLGRLIRIVHDADGLLVANNLLCGPRIRNESTSPIDFRANVERDLGAFLVSPERGDLHLKAAPPEVAGKGIPLPEVTEDIDRKPRGRTPDIGAHQFTPPQ